MKMILVLHGPNLNLLGEREPGVYGRDSLKKINEEIAKKCERSGLHCEFFQSNSEGEIIDKIHEVSTEYDGCIINCGAYTHYSYAIRDAISAVRKPFIEVHMSNIYAREEFRHTSVIAPVCIGQISGFGKRSYCLAVDAILDLL